MDPTRQGDAGEGPFANGGDDMDDRVFDGAARALAGDASRRRLIGGLAATLVGAVVGGRVVAAKPGNGNAGGNGKNAGKVGYCHQTGNGSYRFITVSANAKGHQKHEGDILCPSATEDPCNTYSSCDEAGCVPTPVVVPDGGAPIACTTDLGEDGTCQEGACVATEVTTP